MSSSTMNTSPSDDGQRERIGREIEQATRDGPFGALESSITRAFSGINHRGQPGALPMHKDHFGLTFFTRPRLNLSTDNISFDRRMAFLITDEANSINNYIRCMLDPELQIGPEAIKCDLVDPRQAFIPIFTNTLESLPGWRDLAPGTHTSAEGIYKESMSWIDGPSIDYTTYDINGSFRNVVGNVITRMAFIWTHYQSLIFEDTLVPYPQYWLENEMDFNTRIFRLNLDPTRRYVTQVTSTIATPISAPIGAAANFENSGPYNRSNDQVSVNFRCHGLETYDAILIKEFNLLVEQSNPQMVDGPRQTNYVKIPQWYLGILNHEGFPRIDPATNELEWWISRARFTQRLGTAALDEALNPPALPEP